jgi:hypothetical protein
LEVRLFTEVLHAALHCGAEHKEIVTEEVMCNLKAIPIVIPFISIFKLFENVSDILFRFHFADSSVKSLDIEDFTDARLRYEFGINLACSTKRVKWGVCSFGL